MQFAVAHQPCHIGTVKPNEIPVSRIVIGLTNDPDSAGFEPPFFADLQSSPVFRDLDIAAVDGPAVAWSGSVSDYGIRGR